jgi:hypothetical protein
MVLPVTSTDTHHTAGLANSCLQRVFSGAFSKSRAAVIGLRAGCMSQGLPAAGAASCHTSAATRSTLAQGNPAIAGWRRGLHALWLIVNLTAGPAAAAATAAMPAACPAAPLLRFVPLGPGAWWVPAVDGESTEANRGNVANLLVVRDGRRLWLVGSGPSPAFGRALACRVRQHFGRPVTDIVDPWARAELVLGNAGLPGVRLWAHRQVAAAMGEQCPQCIERLRQRIGTSSTDLGEQPARLPTRLLDGRQGSLGPFDWWALPRAAGRIVTVWRHRASGVTSAHGLLWFDGPPDGRDADLQTLAASTLHLATLAAAGTRWVGEQGPPGPADAPVLQAAYWRAVLDAAQRGVVAGQIAAEVPELPSWPEALVGHPRHALNWQRAWRQAEDRLLREPDEPPR